MWLREAGGCAEPWASPAWPLPDPRRSQGAWKPVSRQGRVVMQPHSRKQSPEGARSCDITATNPSCFLKAFP